jgi:hypothetical protein
VTSLLKVATVYRENYYHTKHKNKLRKNILRVATRSPTRESLNSELRLSSYDLLKILVLDTKETRCIISLSMFHVKMRSLDDKQY